MTNEAIKRYAPSSQGDVISDYTCADATGIEKGACLSLIDPRTAIIATTALSGAAGICAREKIAGSGRTQVAVYREGDFDMVASGTIAVGAPVKFAGNPTNTVMTAVSSDSGAVVIGYALETASDQEVIQVRLRL